MAFIKPFIEIGKEDAGIAGGKGASLGEMTQAGIPVPPGYVVLASTFEEFIDKTNLNVEINAVLDTVKHEEMQTVEQASEKIQALIMNAKMPEDIAEDVMKHFKELGAEFVAVRSSATAEDSASAAWAGQLDTYLNTTEDKVLEKVQECWASLFTPRAIFYRFEKGLHDTKISVAVVVQKMVASDASGIAFSVHPVTEDRNQLIIEASWGLGEAIVSGQVTPDSFVVTKEPREILDKGIATKERGMYRKAGGGNEWQDVPAEKKDIQTLTDEQVFALAETVMGIERHYGFPCDIEWAMEAGKIYITQSRPITTLSSAPPETFNEAPPAGAAGAPGTWEVIAKDFHSPLFRNEIWVEGWTRFGAQFSVTAPRLGMASERDEIRYLAIPSDWQEAHDAIRRKALDDKNFVERIIDETNACGEEFNAWSKKHLHGANLASKNGAELTALLDEFRARQAQMYAYGVMLPVLDFGGHAYVEGNLDRILKEKAAPEEYQRYYEIFTAPLHNSFAQDQEESLLRIMQMSGKDFDAALAHHAEEYAWIYYVYAGQACTESDFRNAIEEYRAKGVDPEKKFAAEEMRKEESATLREKAIKELAPSSFDESLLRLAGKMVWAKPRRKDYQSRSYYHAQRLLEEIGARGGFSLQQVRSVPVTHLRKILEGKKGDAALADALFERHVCVPRDGGVVILSGAEAVEFIRTEIQAEASHAGTGKGELKGTTARKGKAKGTVRIVNKAEDMGKMQDGDILISIATTPSVVPAMKKAAAIATDEGGLTCHAAIVSRELGIPCVVGLKIATEVFKDGDQVEVDADNGIVRKI